MNNSYNPNLKNIPKGIPIEELDLKVRSFNALKRAGVNSVYELFQEIENNTFSKIRNIGDQSTEEIINKLDKFLTNNNLSFGISNPSTSLDLDQTAKTSSPDEEINLPEVGMVTDLPLTLLDSYFGDQMVERLLLIDIKTIGELHNLLLQYGNFITPSSQFMDKTIQLLSLEIRKLINQGNLSPRCSIESTTLLELLDRKPTEEEQKVIQIHFLKRVIKAKSLDHEITEIISDLSERQLQIFLDYSIHDLKLEEIAQKQVPSVTRERIRQILSEATTKLRRNVDRSLKIYIQTAFVVANDLGTSLSQDAWKSQLIEKRIILDDDQNCQTFDYFCALLKNKQTSHSILGIPDSVKTILNNLNSQPLYVSKYLVSDTKENLRRLKRIVNYTGGIDFNATKEVLGCKTEEVAEILKTQDITEIIPGWFSYSGKTALDKKTSLFRAGLIMMQACGPLNFESFCDGLRRYISRHFDSLAPTEVIKHVLKNFGFKIENNLVSYEGKEKVQFSYSDTTLMNLLHERGHVLSFHDIVKYFQASDFSFATATCRVMQDSPILEKIEPGLYKLRGSEVTMQDLEATRARQAESKKGRRGDTIRNVGTSFTIDRLIRYQVTLGARDLKGVVKIIQSRPRLPDFSEGWPVYVNQERVGFIYRRKDYIWGLGQSFKKLGAKVGDRIELVFDKGQEKRVIARIMQENHK